MEPYFLNRTRVGRSELTVTRLGLGTAALGGWPRAVPRQQAIATIDRAWQRGIRHFDTAPFYGHGNSEHNLGNALQCRPRHQFTLSTKVGRVLEPGPTYGGLYEGAAPYTPRFDFSREGIKRSFTDSQQRLGNANIDIVFIHDPDDAHEQAISDAYPLLRELRDQGIIKAIGVGMNYSAPLARFAEEADFDCFLLAGRYTLLEQHALDDLLPIAAERGISIFVGGALNSGLLTNPGPHSYYNYEPAPPHVIQRAQEIGSVCAEFDIPLRAAALQFPLANPVVATLLAGARSPEEVDDTLDMLSVVIPADLWSRLKEKGLLREDAPTPDEAIADGL